MSDPSIRRSDLIVDMIRIPHHYHHVDLKTTDFVFHSTVAMSNPPDIPSQQDPDLTFTSHNPTKVVHPSCVHPRVKLSDAQKVSAASKHEINKENASALKVEIDTFFDHRDTEISQLAKKIQQVRGENQAAAQQRNQLPKDPCTDPLECIGSCQRYRNE